MSDESSVLYFPSLPLWRGITSTTSYTALPFSLSIDSNSLLHQPLNDQLASNVLEHYSDDSYGFITKPPGFSDWANCLGARHIAFVSELIGGSTAARILEIGGGSTFVAHQLILQHDISNYTIIDPCLKNIPSPDPRIEIVPEYFKGQDLGTFDYVFSFNCLEHVDNPYHFLNTVAAIRPHGKEIIIGLILPNVATQLKSGDLNMFLHEHISYFTPYSLLQALFVTSLKLLSYKSDRDCFRLTLSPGAPTSNISLIHDIDDNTPFYYEHLASIVSHNIEYFTQLISAIDNFAFHGATNGLNNLLHLTHPTPSQYTIYDGDASKQGLYIPANHLPINHVSEPTYSEHSSLIISAMTYFTEITSSLSSIHPSWSPKIYPVTKPPLLLQPPSSTCEP